MAESQELDLPVEAEGCLHVYQMYTVKLKGADRAAFLTELRRRGVEASVHFDPPLHQQSLCAGLFRGRRLDLPVTDRVASNIVTLPIYPGLTPEQREHVVGSVKAALPPLVILSVNQPWPSRRPSAPA